VLLTSCSGASETDHVTTALSPSSTPSQFYILPGTGPVGERLLPNRTVQDLEKVIATRNQFYISTGAGPVGERFLAADGDDV
jgi:hypothetical protein